MVWVWDWGLKFNPQTQTDEEAKRVELLKLIKELNMEIIPTEGAIFDVSRFDMAKLGDDTKTIEHLRNYKKGLSARI